MIEVNKVTFSEAMTYIKPVLRIVCNMNLQSSINQDDWSLNIKIPKFIPVKPEDK